MKDKNSESTQSRGDVRRRDFLKISGSVIGASSLLASRQLFADEPKKTTAGAQAQKPAEAKKTPAPTVKPKTNIQPVLEVPRTKTSLPGLYPGRVIEVHDEKASKDSGVDAKVVKSMFHKGLRELTGKSPEQSFGLFFSKNDIVGIKVNPVGAGIISTHLEVVDAIVSWLVKGGLPRKNIIIWDRFAHMLTEAGFVPKRFPGVRFEALQTMDKDAEDDKKEPDDSVWMGSDGNHVSLENFDRNVFYWVDCEAPKDKGYLNQHVTNGRHSFFGKLLTQRLTKIINVPVFKNTGNGISMATKNLGYAAICNTGRLHKTMMFYVCTDVLAFPAIRDKLVLNITDGLRAQYDGGPMGVAKYTYPYNRLFFATDPFALDMTCHNLMVEKRKSIKVRVDEHPRFSDYLHYAQKVGLGITDVKKIEHIKI